MDKNLEDKLNEFKRGYLKKLEGVLLDFQIMLKSDQIDVKDLYIKVHTISGTCGMYGLSVLSKLSNEFEEYLKPIKEEAGDINFNQEELKNKFLKYVDSIEEILKGD